MEDIVLYQTLEDRNNPDEIEGNGPFFCSRSDAWLGHGYYFWEEFIENAHWWGHKGCNGTYVICQAECSYDTTNCLDLYGNLKHLKKFREIYFIMQEEGLANEKTTVNRILHFIKEQPEFNYEAIRANGIHTKTAHEFISNKYSLTVKFNARKSQQLDIQPPVQICILKKSGLNLRNFRIIYPNHYMT